MSVASHPDRAAGPRRVRPPPHRPRPGRARGHAGHHRRRQPGRADGPRRARAHPPAPAARPAGRPQRAGGAGRPPGAGRPQRGAHLADRHGVLRHGHARRSSSATCSRTRPGTRPTRRTSRRSARAGWRRSSTSRRWSPTSPGMDLANASMLDEATAAAEAMTMARRLSKSPSDTFVVDPDTHPQTIAVLRTRAEPVGIDARGRRRRRASTRGCFGVLLSYPGSSGRRRPTWSRLDRRGPRPAAGSRSSPPTCSPCVLLSAARSPGRRHRRRVGPALRRADGLRRPPRRLPGHPRRLRPVAARPPGRASAPTPPAAPRCASPCRPASSTSAGRRRPATSAPRRCCWPTSPACTPCGTAPTGCAASPSGSTA